MSKKKLAKRIRKFLDTYARKTEDGEWTSPDAYQLEDCADVLDTGKFPDRVPFSEWGSGGYHPYLSKIGRKEHDSILVKIVNLLITKRKHD
jgi:hypothetical protein